MPVVLNHMIVPAADKGVAAAFFAGLLGVPVSAEAGPFAPVRVNDELTLDFDERRRAEPGHYAFLVDDGTFDALMERLGRDPAIEYGAGPEEGWNRGINRLGGGRGVYVRDPNGHSYEFFTVVP
ncbi:VOC family protein [Sphaerisporangium aureirubrum]|uniref:VOC family protein n=1 Tax=Sphaerisporangium aureirubrum TaxID=1544736 RepID=A0ABW1NSE5_9ACTN